MAQAKKEPLMMSRAERESFLADIYSKLPGSLARKVRLEDGRLRFTVKGVGLTIRSIGVATKFLGCNITNGARDVLLQPGYEERHLLTPGHDYEMVIYQGKEFREHPDRTKVNVKKLAMAEFGDAVNVEPEAEFVFLVRKMFTDAELQMLGLQYLAVLHPVIGADVIQNQLLSRQKGGDPWVQPWVINQNIPWDEKAGFAFPLL